jgi:hypothetical protein
LTIVNLATRLLAILTCFTTEIKPSVNFEKIIRELSLICLENNKKLVAYTLLTKYIGQSSYQYIVYLIQNTEELASYRNHTHPIVTLPIMNRNT